MKTVIIGGVAGGASAAARLRRLDEKAEIILIERGEFISFANCGLPYYIGGKIQNEAALTLQTPKSFYKRFRIDVRTKQEAVSIDPEQKVVVIQNLATQERYQETYDSLLLSPGAEPAKPPIEGIGLPGVFSLRNIPDTVQIRNFLDEKQPASAVIVGGGYIGLEMAENLYNNGLHITIVEQSSHLIASLDPEIAADVHNYLQTKGIRLCLHNGVNQIRENGGNLTVALQNGEIQADMVFVATGVRPETNLATACGIKTNERGAILVNAHMQTNIPDIYAVGDAIQVEHFITGSPAMIPLAGPANKQGRIAADNIAAGDSEYRGTQGTSIIKIFDMAAASTGITEAAAKNAGIDYDKIYLYSPAHAAYYPGSTNVSIKALWDKKDGKLLGAQVTGFEGVDKRADVLATAIRFHAKITDLTQLELSYAPPFGSAKDPVNMVGFAAENVITGKVKQFFLEDIQALPKDGSVTLLDVRTQTETSHGMIEGFQNIPLDSLREDLCKIPKDKPVYVHCLSGLRSYIACRILTGNGYDCYNLTGGWRLYESVKRAYNTNFPGIS